MPMPYEKRQEPKTGYRNATQHEIGYEMLAGYDISTLRQMKEFIGTPIYVVVAKAFEKMRIDRVESSFAMDSKDENLAIKHALNRGIVAGLNEFEAFLSRVKKEYERRTSESAVEHAAIK